MIQTGRISDRKKTMLVGLFVQAFLTEASFVPLTASHLQPPVLPQATFGLTGRGSRHPEKFYPEGAIFEGHRR